MATAIERYKRGVTRNLRCDSVAKRRLMARFEDTLKVYLEDFGWPNNSPSEQDLVNAFGPPAQMADILLADTTAEEQARYRKKKKVKKAIAAILIAVLVLLTVYIWIYKDVGITSVDDVGPVQTQETT